MKYYFALSYVQFNSQSDSLLLEDRRSDTSSNAADHKLLLSFIKLAVL